MLFCIKKSLCELENQALERIGVSFFRLVVFLVKWLVCLIFFEELRFYPFLIFCTTQRQKSMQLATVEVEEYNNQNLKLIKK